MLDPAFKTTKDAHFADVDKGHAGSVRGAHRRVTLDGEASIFEPMPSDRSQWPVRRYRLGAEPDDVHETTTPAQRIAMMWDLAREGWLLSGRSLPTYDRSSTPTRLYRRGERPPEE